jgi:hypothetical protein
MDLNLLRHRLRLEARDALELVLLPGISALLPWRLAFRVLKALSTWGFPYRGSPEQAAHVAARMGACEDSDPARMEFARQRRLWMLVDHADLYLSRTRGDGWMRRNLDITGNWPRSGQAALLLTFHWGAGMWGLRSAAAAGLTPNALVAPLDETGFSGHRLAWRYARARNATVAAALGRPPLDVGGSLRPVLKALKAGEPVLAVVDAPADHASASAEVSLYGRRARVARPLFRLAVEHGIPVYVYLTGMNRKNGRRFLHIHDLGVQNNLDALIGDTFARLDQALHDDPGAWHFWSIAERVFVEQIPESPGVISRSASS